MYIVVSFVVMNKCIFFLLDSQARACCSSLANYQFNLGHLRPVKFSFGIHFRLKTTVVYFLYGQKVNTFLVMI